MAITKPHNHIQTVMFVITRFLLMTCMSMFDFLSRPFWKQQQKQ